MLSRSDKVRFDSEQGSVQRLGGEWPFCLVLCPGGREGAGQPGPEGGQGTFLPAKSSCPPDSRGKCSTWADAVSGTPHLPVCNPGQV